ncbi:hypothetical protein MHB42_00760 [Lysinibacillus sp. FSL K6-0232]|uniref:hypothetical protein n=1 Tax=Lysinibacillus sp. FSL K6-0232 TaxID=2921425 RepID=UPI0030F5DB93
MKNKIENKQVEMVKTNIELTSNEVVTYLPEELCGPYDAIAIDTRLDIEGVSYIFQFGITRNEEELLVSATCQDTDIRNLVLKYPNLLKDIMHHESIHKMLKASFEKAILDIYSEINQELLGAKSIHFEGVSLSDNAKKSVLELEEMFLDAEYPRRWIFE